MHLNNLLRASIIFLIGFLIANFINFYFVYGLENPLFKNFGFSDSKEAPFDFIKEDQIEVYPDKVIIKIKNPSIGRYAPTGSMVPTFNENSNGIRIKPRSEKDIHVGDIITFRQDGSLIVHRVIDIGTDKDGTYFITRGDSNSLDDGKIRFKDIQYVMVGIIW